MHIEHIQFSATMLNPVAFKSNSASTIWACIWAFGGIAKSNFIWTNFCIISSCVCMFRLQYSRAPIESRQAIECKIAQMPLLSERARARLSTRVDQIAIFDILGIDFLLFRIIKSNYIPLLDLFPSDGLLGSFTQFGLPLCFYTHRESFLVASYPNSILWESGNFYGSLLCFSAVPCIEPKTTTTTNTKNVMSVSS